MKAYLRYEHHDAFGLIASPNCNAVVHPDGTVFTGALESVLRWSVRRSTVTQKLRVAGAGSTGGSEVVAEVVRLELDPTAQTLAVGHFDGRVRLWDLASGTERVALYGHRRAITALRFDKAGLQLASGSADTDVVVWDVAAETGLFRLHGHRDQVTDLVFLDSGRLLASCGKDALLKLWDLRAQHCVHTAVGHAGEVWSMDASQDGRRLVSAGVDDEVRLWVVRVEAEAEPPAPSEATSVVGAASASTLVRSASLVPAGTLGRKGKARVVSLRFDPTGLFLAVASLDRSVDVFSMRTAAQQRLAAKRLGKRSGERAARKARKLEAKRFVDDDEPVEEEEEEGAGADADGRADGAVDVSVEFAPHSHIHATHKLSSVAFAPDTRAAALAALGAQATGAAAEKPAAMLLLCLRSNELAAFAIARERAPAAGAVANGSADGAGKAGAQGEPTRGACAAGIVRAGGHRSEIRGLCLSGDGRLVASVSDGEACVWSAESGQLLHALPCGYGLCAVFVAAASHLAVGTKTGEIALFSLGAAALVQELAAHEGKAVWSIAVSPGGLALVSAGADKCVRSWSLEALRATAPEADGSGVARVAALRLSPEKVLRLTEDALAVCPSSDGRLLGVALLDSTVKVVFADSLKFYLSLYGHKLPVLSLDIASDCAILASGSADKGIKLWGLDFGDCRRTLNGHTEAVTSVRFVRDTHYLFSASKDRTVRYWDADRFEPLLVLQGHRAEVWGLDVSRDGSLLASAGRDRSVRLWARTEEQLFVEEEREAELERIFDDSALESARDQDVDALQEREAIRAGGTALATERGDALAEAGHVESGISGLRSLQSLRGTERLLEALSVLKGDDERTAEFEAACAAWEKAGGQRSGARKPVMVPNGLLLGRSPDGYLLHALRAVRPADLEQALLLLPFAGVVSLLTRLVPLPPSPVDAELTAKVALFAVRIHHRQLSASPHLAPLVARLHSKIEQQLRSERAVAGFNLAVLRHFRDEVEAEGDGRLFEEALATRALSLQAAKEPGAAAKGKAKVKGSGKGKRDGASDKKPGKRESGATGKGRKDKTVKGR